MRQDLIKSAVRVFEILEVFNEERRPLRLLHILKKLNYPQSSTTSLLKSMMVTGYISYDRLSRSYFPTPRLASLGDWVNLYLYGEDGLLNLIQSVHEQTDETVVISAQNDIFAQHIRVLQPDHPHKVPPAEGSMRILTQASVGLTLMSRMSPDAVDKLVRHIKAFDSSAVDVAELAEQLESIRQKGYCMLAGRPSPRTSGIAMLLPPSAHGIQMALGVGGLNSRIVLQKSKIIAVMRDAISAYEARMQSRQAVKEAPADAGDVSPRDNSPIR